MHKYPNNYNNCNHCNHCNKNSFNFAQKKENTLCSLHEVENFLCNWIYSFHIPIFFVISGILLSIKEEWKNKDIKSIIIKKFKQIMYPYITFSCLVLIYSIVMNPEKVLEIVQKTIFLEGYNTLWFLPCLFIAECLFLILQKK